MKITRRTALATLGSAMSMAGLAHHSAWGAPTPMPRLPLDEFAQRQDLVDALSKGVAEMKKRPPSDPLSWAYQAAIHGVPDDRLAKWTYDDPGMAKVDIKKYWNQCPHNGQNSANFLPWHRGYTYHFERILRMHTGMADFSLPYWNYTDATNDRKFPKIYGVQYLDGDLSNDDPSNINTLWDDARDFYFTTYQHPLTPNMPLLSLTDQAVDISIPMASPVFFGEDERHGLGGGIADQDRGTRGLLESYPHDQIHRAVGGIIGDYSGDMATPPTAGFDPIFCVHHTNIDWLWVKWACMPGKTWGKLPPASWFDEKPWYFFDEQGQEVNLPRRAFFDHRALGIRFKYEDMACTPLQLPNPIPEGLMLTEQALAQPAALAKADINVVATSGKPTRLKLDAAVGSDFLHSLKSLVGDAKSPAPTFLRLTDIEFKSVPNVGFDVHLAPASQDSFSRSDPSFLGSINLFNHGHMGMPVSQTFDIRKAAARAKHAIGDLVLTFVPYALLKVTRTGEPYLRSQPLSIRGIELLSSG